MVRIASQSTEAPKALQRRTPRFPQIFSIPPLANKVWDFVYYSKIRIFYQDIKFEHTASVVGSQYSFPKTNSTKHINERKAETPKKKVAFGRYWAVPIEKKKKNKAMKKLIGSFHFIDSSDFTDSCLPSAFIDSIGVANEACWLEFMSDDFSVSFSGTSEKKLIIRSHPTLRAEIVLFRNILSV